MLHPIGALLSALCAAPGATAAGYGLRRVHAMLAGSAELAETDWHIARAKNDAAASADPRAVNGAAGREETRPRRTLLVLGMPGTISPSLIHAVEREFPWVRVEHRPDIVALCAAVSHPAALILVDAPFLDAVEAAAADILRRHPQAIAALVETNSHQPAHSFPDLAGSQLIRGVLPMNLGLDIWLSVVRLMLCGGDYFPPHMFHPRRDGLPGAPAAALGDGALAGLTPREVQILEMVARGLQNKSIAAAFSLSESTVKIHIHNIISKLGVHNRTEAAARFRDRDMRPGP